MLKNVKSKFILDFLFSFIEKGKKLDLIKYNKYFQNLFGINILNYKPFKARYIIFEKDGKGKEYLGHNDVLIFEGEYLNGKRKGKGKEYNENGKLIFEGEYLNGKNGKEKNIMMMVY